MPTNGSICSLRSPVGWLMGVPDDHQEIDIAVSMGITACLGTEDINVLRFELMDQGCNDRCQLSCLFGIECWHLPTNDGLEVDCPR